MPTVGQLAQEQAGYAGEGRFGGTLTSKKHVRDALARHLDEAPIALDLILPLHWQLDEAVGETLTTDLLGTGGKWEILTATRGCATVIPPKCGLYMFVYRSHLTMEFENKPPHRQTWVLYVGRGGSADSTNTLRKRYKNEYSKFVGGDLEHLWNETEPKNRTNNLKRYLTIYPLEYWFLVVEDRHKIADLERRLIKIFSPPLNSSGKIRARAGPPEAAFKEL